MYFLMSQTTYHQCYDPTMNTFKINKENYSKISMFTYIKDLLCGQTYINDTCQLILVRGKIESEKDLIQSFFKFDMCNISVIDCMELP